LGGGELWTSPGLLGYPELSALQLLLAEQVLEEPGGSALDLSAQSGLLAKILPRPPQLVERSKAALNAAARNGLNALAALPWDLEGRYDLSLAILPAHLGNAAVAQVLDAAARCTAPSGRCLLAGEQRRGFSRYLEWAGERFARCEVVRRSQGLRIARCSEPLPLGEVQVPWSYRSERGLTVCTLPGVFGQSGTDPGSALLLSAVKGRLEGLRVLDLGSGSGILGACAAQAGAAAVLLDDDLAAVRSSQQTLIASGLTGTCLHSDICSELPAGSRFDLALINPPFHQGSQLSLNLGLRFLEQASCCCEEVLMVANAFLPYPKRLSELGDWSELATDGRYRVWSLRPGPRVTGSGRSSSKATGLSSCR
jgi:16S rRNA G1207 methylase RsmC